MATDWQESEMGDTCKPATGPRSRRSVQIEWISAGTVHLGFPALLSVPTLLSREIMSDRRHYPTQTNWLWLQVTPDVCRYRRTNLYLWNRGLFSSYFFHREDIVASSTPSHAWCTHAMNWLISGCLSPTNWVHGFWLEMVFLPRSRFLFQFKSWRQAKTQLACTLSQAPQRFLLAFNLICDLWHSLALRPANRGVLSWNVYGITIGLPTSQLKF